MATTPDDKKKKKAGKKPSVTFRSPMIEEVKVFRTAGYTMVCRPTPFTNSINYLIYITDFTDLGTGKEECDMAPILDELRYFRPKKDKLQIDLNSNGGYTHNGFAFLHAVQEATRGDYLTTVSGVAASMAAVIFLSGRYRKMGPYATIMLHDIQHAIKSNVHNIVGSASHSARLFRDYYKEHMVKTEFITSEECDKLQDGLDMWISYRDARKRGMITDMEGPNEER